MWRSRGFDEHLIETLTLDEDKTHHPVLGLCYRVKTASAHKGSSDLEALMWFRVRCPSLPIGFGTLLLPRFALGSLSCQITGRRWRMCIVPWRPWQRQNDPPLTPRMLSQGTRGAKGYKRASQVLARTGGVKRRRQVEPLQALADEGASGSAMAGEEGAAGENQEEGSKISNDPSGASSSNASCSSSSDSSSDKKKKKKHSKKSKTKKSKKKGKSAKKEKKDKRGKKAKSEKQLEKDTHCRGRRSIRTPSLASALFDHAEASRIPSHKIAH